MMMTGRHTNETLYSNLRRTLVKKRLLLFAAGILGTAVVCVAMLIALSAVAGIVVLPVGVKIALLAVAVVAILIAFARTALVRLFSGNIEVVALDLEREYPDLKGRLIAAIQFARMKSTPGYSPELMQSTREQAIEKSEQINFDTALSFYPLIKTVRILAAVTVMALIMLLISPGLFTHSYRVYSNPLTVVAPPLGYNLIAFPGSVQWVKYRDINIGASLYGDKLPRQAVIHHRLAGGSWQETKVDISKAETHSFSWGDSVIVALTLRQINKSFDYYVQAGRLKTELQRIDVVDRPRVTGIELSLFYPEYTGLSPTIIKENNGSFSAVVGSRANMKVTTNLPVQSAGLVFADSSRVAMVIENGAATTSLTVDSSRAYYIRLRDHLGEQNPDPIEYYITAVPDEFPLIDVVRPGFDVNLNDEMMLPLKVHIFDDYGFSSLVLKYTVVSQGRQSEENVVVLHFSERIKTEGEIEFNWDMDRLNLFPGDFVNYLFEVADNDLISGPKVTRTRQYVARLPSLDEIIAQTEAENAQRILSTESIMRTGKDLSQRLKNVSRKLQAQNNQIEQTNWQNRKELETVLDKNAEMVDKIEQIAEDMEKSLEELNDKALLSRDILEKLAQVQQLFEEVATPEMKEAQRKLWEALRETDPQQLQDAIQDFQISQDELLERLERTLALLKKMQLEQALEAMIRKAEEIARRQEEINKQTDTLSEANLSGLSDDESQLKDALEQLQVQAGEMDELARQAEMEQASEFQQFKEAVTRTDAGQNMQNMAGALDEQKREVASDQGKQAYSKLMEMIDRMQQQMMAMKGEQNEAFFREMEMALQDANNLSGMQEELLQGALEMSPQSMMLRDLATEQQDLSNAVSGLRGRISELGKQSPFVASELSRLIEDASRQMDMAMQHFDAKNGRRAADSQREAMVNLNRASIRLMESLSQMQQSQSGSSCSKGTSMLQGLAEQQNQLNQQTQQQLGHSGFNLEPGQGDFNRETLQRLAGEQGAIRKSMEDLGREFAGSRQILGRLDDIANSMKEIEEALSSGNPGSEVIDRQLKIYSRMLEASRSLYRKDFSEQRQSKTATNQAFYVPPELSRDILNDRMKLEDRLRQYLGDSYPPQYEEQIKAYFRALLQAETNLIRQNNGNGESSGGQ